MALIHSLKRDGGQPQAFKEFPVFTKLAMSDRRQFESLVQQYPPISDITFTTLMLWWNHLNSLAVASLNSNLIISYWLPGDDRWSGLSVLGTSAIDETISHVFDYLKLHRGDEDTKLVHIPEFVIEQMQHPELYSYDPERDLDEYVIPVSKSYPLNHMVSFRRRRVRSFMDAVDEHSVSVRSVDLTVKANKERLRAATNRWPKKGTLSMPSQLSEEALSLALNDSEALGIENVCLFIGDTLHAFALYYQPSDKRYAIISHIRLSQSLPFLLDYLLYVFSRWFAEQNILFLNLDVDFGTPVLRMIKLMLGPDNFFRKYTVRPAR